ncbi:fimbria/pilus periplasmic chaperone [Cupriavidus basilensis]
MTLSIPKSKLSRVMAIVSASIVSASIASTAAAAVVVSGTRVIFPAEEREMTIKVTNDGRLPSLVQTWIDVGNENDSPDKIDVPFTLTPTMFRVEPGKGQTLRIIYTNEPLPTDKESLFWLNVLDVPPKPTAEDERNRLQVAFRTRIKLMYRPAGLPGKVDEAPALLKWHIARDPEANQYVLKTVNPSPYVVSLGSVQLKVGGRRSMRAWGMCVLVDRRHFRSRGWNRCPPRKRRSNTAASTIGAATRTPRYPSPPTHETSRSGQHVLTSLPAG